MRVVRLAKIPIHFHACWSVILGRFGCFDTRTGCNRLAAETLTNLFRFLAPVALSNFGRLPVVPGDKARGWYTYSYKSSFAMRWKGEEIC